MVAPAAVQSHCLRDMADAEPVLALFFMCAPNSVLPTNLYTIPAANENIFAEDHVWSFGQWVSGSVGCSTSACDIIHGTVQHLTYLGNSLRSCAAEKCQMSGCPMFDVQCSCPTT